MGDDGTNPQGDPSIPKAHDYRSHHPRLQLLQGAINGIRWTQGLQGHFLMGWKGLHAIKKSHLTSCHIYRSQTSILSIPGHIVQEYFIDQYVKKINK